MQVGSTPNAGGNKPVIRRRTSRGNITLSVFCNQRVNRQTGQLFTSNNLVIRTGYQDANGDWVNSDISIDAGLIPNLIATLGHVDFELANNLAQAPAASAPAMQQPATPSVAPVQVDDIPF